MKLDKIKNNINNLDNDDYDILGLILLILFLIIFPITVGIMINISYKENIWQFISALFILFGIINIFWLIYRIFIKE